MNKLLTGKKFWEKIASTYSDNSTFSRKYSLEPALYELFKCVKDKAVIDIGCGVGKITIKLAQLGADCAGIDYSDKALSLAQQKAKKLHLKIEFIRKDIKEIKDIKKQFDIAVISQILPHIKKIYEINKLFYDTNQILKTSGRLILTEPHPVFDVYMRERFSDGSFNYFKSGQPYQFEMNLNNKKFSSQAYHWTLSDYTKVLINNGFTITQLIEPKVIITGKVADKQYYKNKCRYPSYIIFDCIKTKKV